MVHTPEIYIQQESVSAYIPHSNNAKTNFPQTTNKQPPHRIENRGSGKKNTWAEMKNGRTESIKIKLDLAIFAAAVVVVVLPRRQDRRRRSGECVYVVVASGWAVRFGATQERRVCVFVGPFSCTEKQNKVQVVREKGHWKGRWGIRTFGCPLDPAKDFDTRASPMVLRMWFCTGENLDEENPKCAGLAHEKNWFWLRIIAHVAVAATQRSIIVECLVSAFCVWPFSFKILLLLLLF
jgi:hypothetical protein